MAEVVKSLPGNYALSDMLLHEYYTIWTYGDVLVQFLLKAIKH